MDGRLTWTDCDKAGDYVVPNVLSPRDLVSRPDNMDETIPHTILETYISKLQDTVMILSFRTDRSGQTVQTQNRLLLEEQSDQGLNCLLFHFFEEKQ